MVCLNMQLCCIVHAHAGRAYTSQVLTLGCQQAAVLYAAAAAVVQTCVRMGTVRV